MFRYSCSNGFHGSTFIEIGAVLRPTRAEIALVEGLMRNINKKTKSSIEWLVYKPGLRRNSGEDLASWWTTS